MGEVTIGRGSQHDEPGDWAQRIRRLDEEVTGLRRAMANRGIIEQAKGVLAERMGIHPEEAYRHLATISQQTNVKVVDVAADVLASVEAEPRSRPSRPSPPSHLTEVLPTATPTQSVSTPTTLARQLQRLQARVGSANTVDEVVVAVAAEAGPAAGARSVMAFLLEPDGGLALVASSGLSDAEVRDWRHVPASIVTTAGLTARTATSAWYEAPAAGGVLAVGPGGPRFASPVAVGSVGVGVLELALAGPVSTEVREWLASTADIAAGRLSDLDWVPAAEAPSGAAPHDRWLLIAIDAAATPCVLLRPLEDSRGPADFIIEHANAEAVAAWAIDGSATGRRLLDVAPGLVASGDFDLLVAVASAGPTSTVPATGERLRIRWAGAHLLATWAAPGLATEPDDRLLLASMEQTGAFAWAVWTKALVPVRWSSGLYLWLDRDPDDGPMDLSRVLARVDPDDRPRLRQALETAADRGAGDAFTMRLDDGAGSARPVEVVVMARRVRGRPIRTVLSVFRDLTDAQRRDEEAHSNSNRLAEQRVRAAAQRLQTENLRRTFYPPTRSAHRLEGAEIIARHAAPQGIAGFRGDFYDVILRPNRAVASVGDVFGSGVGAAATMVRVRHAVRALALAGHPPADVLRLVNDELSRDDDPPLASALVLTVSADGATVDWAQAGHYTPILLRGNRVRPVRRPKGDALGLRTDTVFAGATLRLEPGDVLFCYTDGVLDPDIRAGHPVRRLAADVVAAYRKGGIRAMVDEPRPTDDEVCVVALQRLPR